jgi:hypothetical protein
MMGIVHNVREPRNQRVIMPIIFLVSRCKVLLAGNVMFASYWCLTFK